MAEMKKKKKALRIILPAALAAGAVLVGAVLWLSDSPESRVTAAETLEKYMACISEGDYEQMYQMLDENSRRAVSYTHLDVYKRQPPDIAIIPGIILYLAACYIFSRPFTAVSAFFGKV